MIKPEFPISLVPKDLQKKILYKEYNKQELLLSYDQDKVLYLISGHALVIRYDGDDEHIYPYIFSGDEFIGVKKFTKYSFPIWEVYSNRDKVTCYEIPDDIFEKYIFPSPLYLESYLEKNINVMSQGCKGYYIQVKGGAFVYFTFILYQGFLTYPTITLEKYSILTKVISTSKASLYNFTNKLVEEEIIKKQKNTLTLLNKNKLKKYFEDFIV